MPTYTPKAGDTTRSWYVIDATDVRLGRLAVQVANLLRGKHKAMFANHVDTGDFVIVINAAKVSLSSNKAATKMAYRHSGYPGGIYERTFTEMQQQFPERVLEKAVKGMLPKGPLGYAMLAKLKVYAGNEHPHTAQQPKALEI